MAAPIRNDELYRPDQPKGVDWETARLKALQDQMELRAKFVKAGLIAGGVLILLTLFMLRGTFYFAIITRNFDQKEITKLSHIQYPLKPADELGNPITPYRTGKIVIVQRQLTKGMLGPTPFGDEVITEAQIDKDFAELPGPLRASRMGEVKTVVIVRRSFKAFKKEKTHVEVWVYDVGLKSQVAHTNLHGRSLGDDPDVAAYVVGLPAK